MHYYLHILNHENKSYINIKLTEKECKKYDLYDNLKDFIIYEKIGEKYGFNINTSDYMMSSKNDINYKM